MADSEGGSRGGRHREAEGDPAAGEALQRLVTAVLETSKYGTLCPEVVRRIGEGELRKRRRWKEALKETKNRLHQIAGAYLEGPPSYDRWLAMRPASSDSSVDAWKSVLLPMMRRHASTRERLPDLELFYPRVLGDIAPVRSVLDIACGLNPLALPWMPLAAQARYFACDLYTDMMAFVNRFFADSPYSVYAQACDVVVHVPDEPVDVALVLKFLPVLEQTEKTAALGWLSGLKARYLLVSFPTRTLGGRDVRMAENYEAHFREIIQAAGWRAARFAFETELCFLVDTGQTRFAPAER